MAERVRRFDRVAIPASKRTQEGFLRLDGNKIARTGIQEYRRADGSLVRELREPTQVFDDASMDSFALLPLTNQHPSKMLSPTDVKQFAVGSVGKPEKQDSWLVAPIGVWEQGAIAAIEAGRVELSAGYSCEIVNEPGEWNGEKYDCKQVNIVANHLALVDAARAGPEARLRLDAGDAVAADIGFAVNSPAPLPCKGQEEKEMAHSLKIDGMTFEVADANAQAVVDRALAAAKKDAESARDAEKARADKAEADLKDAKARLDALTDKQREDAEKMMKCDECNGSGKYDGKDCPGCEGKGEFPAKMDSAEKRAERTNRRIDREVGKRAAARAALLVEARARLGANEKLDDKSDLEIKALIVKKLSPKANLDGKDAAYIEARYDACIEEHPAPKPIDGPRLVAVPSEDKRTDRSDDPETARNNMIARLHEMQAKAKAKK